MPAGRVVYVLVLLMIQQRVLYQQRYSSDTAQRLYLGNFFVGIFSLYEGYIVSVHYQVLVRISAQMVGADQSSENREVAVVVRPETGGRWCWPIT